MGTRNITQVILDGKTLVSQYCQWDGYPEGQGATVLEFLHSMDRDVFELKLNQCIYPTLDELQQNWRDAFKAIAYPKLVKNNSELADEERKNDKQLALVWEKELKQFEATGMVTFDVSAEFTKHHPTLQRDMGADVLQYIQDSSEPVTLQLDMDFVNDSLFCEWAYVIDLDNNVLEVYEGFNKSPVPADNRFQLPDGMKPRDTADGEEAYYPIVLIHSFPLDDLPDDETFVKVCSPTDDDEDEIEVEPITRQTAKLAVIKIMDAVNLLEGDANRDTMVKMVNYLQANIDDFIEAAN